jgi:hypothetical protein
MKAEGIGDICHGIIDNEVPCKYDTHGPGLLNVELAVANTLSLDSDFWGALRSEITPSSFINSTILSRFLWSSSSSSCRCLRESVTMDGFPALLKTAMASAVTEATALRVVLVSSSSWCWN